MRKTYEGRDIEVTFELGLCIHVGECLLGLPEVFDAQRRPWVLPDAADADAVAEVVERCPSGALQYRRLDGGAEERSPSPATVTPLRNGPLVVRGDVEVTGGDGSTEVLPRATLCRCGLSDSKPFCDNSHLTGGFEAPGTEVSVGSSPVRPAADEPIARTEDPRA